MPAAQLTTHAIALPRMTPANEPYFHKREAPFGGVNADAQGFVVEDASYGMAGQLHAQSSMPTEMGFEDAGRQEVDGSVSRSEFVNEDSGQMAELLRAASTAAGVAGVVHESAVNPQERGKRKRGSDSVDDISDARAREQDMSAAKRRRVDLSTKPHFPPPSSPHSDTHAAGIHSAVALFRRTSERTSRKYTRPPMSKLFISLQLTPENFLQLQAQAKAYMLDIRYPERQNCVGNRGKGDTDMVKLRLFNCVRDFLHAGAGAQFFGELVDTPEESETLEAARALGEDQVPRGEERLVWPRDGNKIIGLVTPLMRRMVTNERQRMYAIETRKGGSKRNDKEGSPGVQGSKGEMGTGGNVEGDVRSALDPSLRQETDSRLATSPVEDVDAPSVLSEHPELSRDEVIKAGRFPRTSAPTDPVLNNLNIFLILTTPTSKSPLRLLEKRIVSTPAQRHLAWYEWATFQRNVEDLLDEASSVYPAIRRTQTNLDETVKRAIPQANALHMSEQSPETETEERRLLSNAPLSDASSISPPAPDLPPSADTISLSVLPPTPSPTLPTPLTSTVLPHTRYTIRSLTSAGWTTIESAATWYSVLLEAAFAVWADGVCNVLVELHGVGGEREAKSGGEGLGMGEGEGGG